MPARTLIVGHTTHDHYRQGLVAGGCAFYGIGAHAFFARADRRPAPQLLTLVGDDFQCVDEVRRFDAHLVQRGRTTTFANYYPSTGPRVQLLEALAPPIAPTDFPTTVGDIDVVHLAPVLGELDLPAWKSWRDRHSPEALLAINVQGWIKIPGPEVPTRSHESLQARGIATTARTVIQQPWDIPAEALTGIDIATVSDEDLIGQGDLLERLRKAVPLVSCTHGKQGATIYHRHHTYQVGIFPADVVDPTGAGDIFAATFIHKIALGLKPPLAARYASAAASIIIEAEGPRALRRLTEVTSRVASIPATRLTAAPA